METRIRRLPANLDASSSISSNVNFPNSEKKILFVREEDCPTNEQISRPIIAITGASSCKCKSKKKRNNRREALKS